MEAMISLKSLTFLSPVAREQPQSRKVHFGRWKLSGEVFLSTFNHMVNQNNLENMICFTF